MANEIAANLEQAFFDRMDNDTELTDLLDTYTIDGTSYPAIFTRRPIREDVHGPYVISAGFVSIPTSVPGRSKQKRARDAVKDISVYTKKADSAATTKNTEMEKAAERIWELFDRHQFSKSKLNGYRSVLTRATGPENAPSGDDSIGRIVQVTAKINET